MEGEIKRVEWHAGYRGEEKPRAVIVGLKRLEVVRIISQKRIRDKTVGRTIEVFNCLLTSGEKVKIEKVLEE
ncbi:MAG: hypothetical protein QME28_08595 [Candidatus Saccharicenans sp.]|nr:hypothetical protein [Candidatus Saccharicenans sp.]